MIVISKERKVQTLYGTGKALTFAFDVFNEAVLRVLEKDSEARPLFKQSVNFDGDSYVVSQQWTWTKREQA